MPIDQQEFARILQRLQEDDPNLDALEFRMAEPPLLSLEQVQKLCEAAAQNTHLTALTLHDQGITCAQVKLMVNIPSLRKLDLTGNKVGLEGITALAASEKLIELNLSWNSLEAKDIWPLSDNKSIILLNLCCNRIHASGIEHLIEHNTTIRQLNAEHNRIVDIKIAPFQKNTALLEFEIEKNFIPCYVLHTIQQCIRRNQGQSAFLRESRIPRLQYNPSFPKLPNLESIQQRLSEINIAEEDREEAVARITMQHAMNPWQPSSTDSSTRTSPNPYCWYQERDNSCRREIGFTPIVSENDEPSKSEASSNQGNEYSFFSCYATRKAAP